jgi:hypothetical protein
MTKITADHLARGAFVYVRQSTADQLVHNQESRRHQYGLADRAKQLGWTSVEVVDEIRPLAAVVSWPGSRACWQRSARDVSERVFAIEASRLAWQRPRPAYADRVLWIGRDVIVDEDGIMILAIPMIAA